MDQMSIALLIDGLVITCLGATLLYIHILNRRMSVILEARVEMFSITDHFTTAIESMQSSVSKLNVTASDTISSFKSDMEEAEIIMADLEFIVQRSEIAVKQLKEDEGLRPYKTTAAKPTSDNKKTKVLPLLKPKRGIPSELAEALKDVR